jgi:hypothetical protein
MSAFSETEPHAGGYDLRSLQHERRMLAAYRQSSTVDATMLQPLANACWRAASFEWQLYRDVETTRRLLGEGARALAQGFARRHAAFDPSPDQFVLALALALAAREREAFTSLALTDPIPRTSAMRQAQAFQGSRAHFHLAEGFALVARAIFEPNVQTARSALSSIKAAREESDRGWWTRQFPDALDAAWRINEHEAICVLLGAIAQEMTGDQSSPALDEPDEMEMGASALRAAQKFADALDDALHALRQFVEQDTDYHPKLYFWLPGIALCALAKSAGVAMDWLDECRANAPAEYSRLPLELISKRAPVA